MSDRFFTLERYLEPGRQRIARRGAFIVVLVSGVLLAAACAPLTGTIAPKASAPPPLPTIVGRDDLTAARQALIGFFAALRRGHYDEAAALYGGSYEAMRDWNPSLPADAHAALWASGCGPNGLRCLDVKRVIREEARAPGEYGFVVEFDDGTGGVLAVGACCAATPEKQPRQREFTYTVRQQGSAFLVQELPVYQP